MERYVLYKRVSTKEQGKSGLGLEAQDRDLVLFLAGYAAPDHSVIGEYTDIQSGSDDARPELMTALEHTRQSGAILLVAKLDRLSRRVSFLATLMEDKGVKFKVAQMPFADKLQLHIYAALAEQERDFISARTKAALQAAKARGVKLGGWRLEAQEANEKRAAEAYEWARLHVLSHALCSDGTFMGAHSLAAELNFKRVLTRTGQLWNEQSARRVIKRLDMANAPR